MYRIPCISKGATGWQQEEGLGGFEGQQTKKKNFFFLSARTTKPLRDVNSLKKSMAHSPLNMQRDLGRLDIRILPLHLRAVHEVAEGVKGLGLPVQWTDPSDPGCCRWVALLVDRRPIAGVLDVQRLEVVHSPGNQITWGATKRKTAVRRNSSPYLAQNRMPWAPLCSPFLQASFLNWEPLKGRVVLRHHKCLALTSLKAIEMNPVIYWNPTFSKMRLDEVVF